MRTFKFNKFERVAGFFVLAAIGGFVFAIGGVAVKQGWFEAKVDYRTIFQQADGVRPGTTVQLAGLKAGSVESVELLSDNRIQVKFYVLSKFSQRIREDSRAQLIRPFVIGDRILEISVGSTEVPILAAKQDVPSIETTDLMTLLSGKQLGSSLDMFAKMVENFKTVVEAFASPERTQAFIQMFDRVDPLLKNLNTMSIEVIRLSRQATKDDRLGETLAQLQVTTRELNSFLPQLAEQSPEFAKDVGQLVSNLSVLTEEFKVVLPALAAIAPELPQTSKRAVEALDEAVVLMKALQRSFFVKGNAEEVREEEQKRSQESRLPAGE